MDTHTTPIAGVSYDTHLDDIQGGRRPRTDLCADGGVAALVRVLLLLGGGGGGDGVRVLLVVVVMVP
jgi:hypothetical protein